MMMATIIITMSSTVPLLLNNSKSISSINTNCRKLLLRNELLYRSADKSLARPDLKQLKVRHFSSDAEVNAAAETRLDGQPSELFLSGLQKLEFGRCSLFPSWSG